MLKRETHRSTRTGESTAMEESVRAFLAEPSTYAERPARVEVRETHLSVLFLTDHHVYKLKKPLRTAEIDWRTAEARRHFCLEELRLNRRLTDGVYLSVLAVGTDADGEPALGESVVSALDWVLVMRRLPDERSLHYLIESESVEEPHIQEVARRLARFYINQPAVSLRPQDYLARLHDSIERNASDLSTAAPHFHFDSLRQQLVAFLDDHQAVFKRRVRTGQIQDGHGDLRPEHIYLTQPLQIIDCLEFSAELRANDVADELAFLALECERLGAAWLGPALFRAYARHTGEQPPAALYRFFMAYRALVWARLGAHHPDAQAPERQARIADYLKLGERQIELAQSLSLSEVF